MLRFEDLAVGMEVSPGRRHVTLAGVKEYADASGDQNPLHQDEAVARAAGFPTVVAHGMFTMGTIASWLLEHLDASVLTRLRVQFRAPVLVGDTIEVGGRVRELDPQGSTAVLDVWVRVERATELEWPIRRGEAVLRVD